MAEQFNRHDWRDQVWQDETLSLADKGVALGILKYVNQDGLLWPTQETLALESGNSIRTIRARTNALVKAGFVRREGRRLWCQNRKKPSA